MYIFVNINIIHIYIRTYVHTQAPSSAQRWRPHQMHTYIYIHTYIYTYIHRHPQAHKDGGLINTDLEGIKISRSVVAEIVKQVCMHVCVGVCM